MSSSRVLNRLRADASAMTLLEVEAGTRLDYRGFQRRAALVDKLAGCGDTRGTGVPRTHDEVSHVERETVVPDCLRRRRRLRPKPPERPSPRGSTVYGDAADTRRSQQHRQHRAALFPYQNYRRGADQVTAVGGPYGLPARCHLPIASAHIRELGGTGPP